MDGQHILFLAIVFIVVVGIAMLALKIFSPVQVRERLTEVVLSLIHILTLPTICSV